MLTEHNPWSSTVMEWSFENFLSHLPATHVGDHLQFCKGAAAPANIRNKVLDHGGWQSL